MLNILIPMAGKNQFDSDEFGYPKPLIEIAGQPMIQRVIECLAKIEGDKRFIFVVNSSDCRQHHLDDVLRLVAGPACEIVELAKPTAGAACTALMAAELIDSDTPLLISNSDHVIESDLNEAFKRFASRRADAGVVCFEAVHPKWSYVRTSEDGTVLEAAEKRPLSRNAIAGLYYFAKGKDFVSATTAMIRKDAHYQGAFYIAPALNELILEQKRVEVFRIPSDTYHNFYAPNKVHEYEAHLLRRRDGVHASET